LQSAPFLRIGTRGSPLALAQAHQVRRLIAEKHGIAEERIAVEVITTSGDRLTDAPLSEVGGKGLFSKEIEAALLANEIDIGVHSAKDLATTLPRGLTLVCVLEREDIRDAFVSLSAKSIEAMPKGARMGTSSIRRAAQVRRVRPDLTIVPFRGNVDTRLRKLHDGVADATLLAVAGLNRLGRQSEITAYLDPRAFPPAPAQGAIAIEGRTGDISVGEMLEALHHRPTARAVLAERAMLKVLDGSCRTAVGVFTEMTDTLITLHGEILAPDGATSAKATASGPIDAPDEVGFELGEKLRALAGPALLAQLAV
jgi:hydroxymethylbilane synthase